MAAASERKIRRRGTAPAPAALILGGDYQGLGVARSLGRRGIPVCVIDDERSIARHSRYVTSTASFESLENAEFVESLLAAGRGRLQGSVLFPTRDETVVALSRHRARLTPVFRVPTPGWDVIGWAVDKRMTYSKAEELGIPTPRTWYVEDAAGIANIDGDPPFVVKPASRGRFLRATKKKAWRADTRAELRERFLQATRLVSPDEIMIQELIPGGGDRQFAYCAFFKDGGAVASMVVRRLRQHPPDFGRASTYVETTESPLLERLSTRFLRAIGYYGLAELEYKLDERDGRYKLLDVNARTWGYHTVGGAAGVDFPWLLFADQAGKEVETSRARAGIAWVRMITDLPTSLLEIAFGRLNVRAYLHSLRRCRTEAVFALDDPLPGAVEVALLPYLALKRGF